jgi:uncharacterized membrane protein
MPEIGVSASYNYGWQQLWKHFWMLLLISIIFFAISSVVYLFSQGLGGIGGLSGFIGFGAAMGLAAISGIFSVAYSIFLTNPLSYSVSYTYLRAVRDDEVEVKDMFEAFSCYWDAVAASLLVGLIVFVGMIFLIVPGIIFGCKLAFVPFLVIDRKMGTIDSIKESWRMTGGYAWKVFLIGLLGIPISIAGLICFGIGIIPASMWISAAYASLYYAVSSSQQAAIPPETVTNV